MAQKMPLFEKKDTSWLKKTPLCLKRRLFSKRDASNAYLQSFPKKKCLPSRPLTENGAKLRHKMIRKEKKSKKEAMCCSKWDKQASNESLVFGLKRFSQIHQWPLNY